MNCCSRVNVVSKWDVGRNRRIIVHGARARENSGRTTATQSIDTMHAHSAKQEAIEIIERLPDNVPLDEIVYQLYVLNKIHQGFEDVDAGRAIPSVELAREIAQW